MTGIVRPFLHSLQVAVLECLFLRGFDFPQEQKITSRILRTKGRAIPRNGRFRGAG